MHALVLIILIIPLSFQADESFVDLSDVVVNTAIHKDIVIVNNSNCSLHYTLHVDQLLEGSYAEEAMAVDPLGEFEDSF